MRVHRHFLHLVFTLTLSTGSASATWLPDGVPICYAPCTPANPRIAPDGVGGIFVVWEDERSRLAIDIYLQHLTAQGDRAAGWPADGLRVCVSPYSKHGPVVVGDGRGGCFVTWTDGRNPSFDIYVQHVRGDGTLAPEWPVNGLPVTREPSSDQGAWPVFDGTGGLFVAWGSRFDWVWIQHLTSSGAPAPSWPADGIAACTLPSLFGNCVPDGSGGAMMVWTDFRRGCTAPDCYDVYGAHYTAEGMLAPGWAANGNLLAPGEWRAPVLPDSAGKFFLISSTPSPYALDVSYSVRRLTVDGVPVSGWTERGVVVGAATGERWGILPAPDGVGGVLLEWYDYRGGGDDVYAARVLPSGTMAPGWPAEGLLVSDPSVGNDTNYGIAPDSSGGGYFAFQYDYPSYVQHITAAGTVAPRWPPYGYRLATTFSQFNPQLVPSIGGGAIAVWEDGGRGLFAQRLEPEGPTPVAVRVSLVSSEATPERVVLLWDGPGAGGLIATVERRMEASAWRPLGRASVAGADRLRFEDRDVMPGSRYAYRLVSSEDSPTLYADESWVEVPSGYRVALAGFRPNPASGSPTVAFELADASPATLELLDVSGRRVVAREVGALGAGSHTLRLEDAALHPGIYWIRLVQSGTVGTRVRGLVLR